MTADHACAICRGTGDIGPVHVRFATHGEWRETMPCHDCGGTGRWSSERLAAYEQGQGMRAARVERGESIRDASKRLGIRPAELCRIERGDVGRKPQ